MNIGSLLMPPGAALAPMAGVTDLSMRVLCNEQGCAWAVTEMLSAKGYVYAPESRAHRELLSTDAREGVTGLQLFGSDENMLSEAVKRLNDSPFAFFDFNMGCPAHKIVSNGEGSALMRYPAKAGLLVESMVKAARKPVTVKIRSGWDREHINAVELARISEASGAAAVAVHPRTRDMFYSGEADWNVIAEVKKTVRIPVIGNGDIRCGQDALRMLHETGCDAVMVARAAQGNPWIFREILAALNGQRLIPPSPEEKMRAAVRHMDMLIDTYGEKLGVMESRKHIAWYIQGMPGSARLRARVNGFASRNEVAEALEEYITALERG